MANGAAITIEVDDAPIRAALNAFAERGGDLSAVMADLGAAMLTSTQQRFEAQAAPGGEKWAPFAPSTLKRMPLRRRANPFLLRDKANLYSSIHADTGDAFAEVGSNLAYAAIHQFGGTVKIPEREQTATFIIVPKGAATTKDGRRVGSRLRFAKASTRSKTRHERTFKAGGHSVTIPARPYLGIDDADRTEILAIIEDHFRGLPGVEAAP